LSRPRPAVCALAGAAIPAVGGARAQAPKIMTRAWPLGDAGKPGPVSTGFAERDDTRTSIRHDGVLRQSITLH
jgi:hypothetical protein